jgi:hypothetical protein
VVIAVRRSGASIEPKAWVEAEHSTGLLYRQIPTRLRDIENTACLLDREQRSGSRRIDVQ